MNDQKWKQTDKMNHMTEWVAFWISILVLIGAPILLRSELAALWAQLIALWPR